MNSIAQLSLKTWLITWLFTFHALWLNISWFSESDDFWFGSWFFIGLGSLFLTVPAFIILIFFNLFSKKFQLTAGVYLCLQLIIALLYVSPFYFLFKDEGSTTHLYLPFIGAAVGILLANLRLYHKGTHPILLRHHSSLFQYNFMETYDNPTTEANTHDTPPASRSYVIKLLILGVMALILFLGTLLVRNLITERQDHSDSAKNFFYSSWGREQTISGPYLTIPVQRRSAKGETYLQYAYLMPKELNLDCALLTETRSKGIYDVPLYKAKQQYSGFFDMKDLQTTDIPFESLLLDRAVLCFGFSDATAFDKLEKLSVNGKTYELEPGLPTKDVTEHGFSTNINMSGVTTLPFQANMTVRGTEEISFVPVGKTSNIKVHSTWPSPNFFGKSVTAEKPQTSDKGFSGQWSIQHLNRSFPQSWIGENYKIDADIVGVSLFDPVNNYVQSERIVKYALLVIGLVFTVFFFIEILNGKHIHPLQYLLVGFALCLFYSLMVSLSEHMLFALAYWIAAAMTVLLIAIYLNSVLSHRKFALISGTTLVLIYGFMYMLLLQEDYALLIGNIGLFVVLALVMYFSRKINWSQLK